MVACHARILEISSVKNSNSYINSTRFAMKGEQLVPIGSPRVGARVSMG